MTTARIAQRRIFIKTIFRLANFKMKFQYYIIVDVETQILKLKGVAELTNKNKVKIKQVCVGYKIYD